MYQITQANQPTIIQSIVHSFSNFPYRVVVTSPNNNGDQVVIKMIKNVGQKLFKLIIGTLRSRVLSLQKKSNFAFQQINELEIIQVCEKQKKMTCLIKRKYIEAPSLNKMLNYKKLEVERVFVCQSLIYYICNLIQICSKDVKNMIFSYQNVFAAANGLRLQLNYSSVPGLGCLLLNDLISKKEYLEVIPFLDPNFFQRTIGDRFNFTQRIYNFIVLLLSFIKQKKAKIIGVSKAVLQYTDMKNITQLNKLLEGNQKKLFSQIQAKTELKIWKFIQAVQKKQLKDWYHAIQILFSLEKQKETCLNVSQIIIKIKEHYYLNKNLKQLSQSIINKQKTKIKFLSQEKKEQNFRSEYELVKQQQLHKLKYFKTRLNILAQKNYVFKIKQLKDQTKKFLLFKYFN